MRKRFKAKVSGVKVWLNKIESKELVNLIQRHFDNQ